VHEDDRLSEGSKQVPAGEADHLFDTTGGDEFRVLRQLEKERQAMEEEEVKELCGAKLVKKVDELVQKLTDGTPYAELQEAYKLMLETGNTQVFTGVLNANTNEDMLSKYIKVFGDGLKKDLSFFSLAKQAQNSKWAE
jgi:hypothetical protein